MSDATISSNNLPPFRATAPGPRGPGPAWDRISSNCSTQGRFDLYKNDAEKFLSERENAANMAKPTYFKWGFFIDPDSMLSVLPQDVLQELS